MHVLLTNDDGPPNEVSSPYIRFFADAISELTSWKLSIVVPDVQRSWIGKAHFAGKELTASFIYPEKHSNSVNGPFPLPNRKYGHLKEWALLDGTPASCADIGVNHLYKERGPVDLVISGPNVGKNATASYILSSGTVGAALEGAIQGKKAIGLSYSYVTKHVPDAILRRAAEISVKLIDKLYKEWDSNADLYSINIPLVESILIKGATKVYYTKILQNRWTSVFTSDSAHLANEASDIVDVTSSNKIQFKWSPNFSLVHQTITDSDGLNDGKVLEDGNISVTPLKACFNDYDGTRELVIDL